MTAVRKNLLADSGTTQRVTVRYLDADKNPVDLTGYTATFSLYKVGQTNNTPLFTKDAPVDSDGWIKHEATDEETALWPVGKLAWTLDLESPAGEVEGLFFGTFQVRTRRDV